MTEYGYLSISGSYYDKNGKRLPFNMDIACDAGGYETVVDKVKEMVACLGGDLVDITSVDSPIEDEYDEPEEPDDLEMGFNPYEGCYDYDC